MANCNNCVKCEGEKVSSNCIVWEGATYDFNSFNELIEFLYNKVKDSESKLDLKTLSNDSDNSIETAVQLLIDRQVQQQYQSTSSTSSGNTFNCNINTSQIDGCSNCSKTLCEKLQLMVNEIALLKAEVNQLKSQI